MVSIDISAIGFERRARPKDRKRAIATVTALQ
jgi:hypothetical protein